MVNFIWVLYLYFICTLHCIFISKKNFSHKKISGELNEHLKTPFKIIDFDKKITSLIAKTKFKRNSLINLKGYIIDKNERKIKKNNLELQLSEKEINFLTLFSQNQNPIDRNIVLKKVWKYSEKSETHTVETHIHRLRKKIFEKFGDDNFIKNNIKGYFIWRKEHEITLQKIYFRQNIKKKLWNPRRVKVVLKGKKINLILPQFVE